MNISLTKSELRDAEVIYAMQIRYYITGTRKLSFV